MNYSKKSTSKKQKALKSKKSKMGKKIATVFLKTLLVLIVAIGVAGICGGIGIIRGVIENAPDITSASVLPRGYKSTVYDAEGNKTKKHREEKAADRIYGLLPKDQQEKLRALWDEFEARETAEAKFAHAMDHVQPLMLNAATEGKSWIEHGVRLSQVLKRNQSTGDGSEELWEYAYENFISPNLEKGRIEKD